MPTSDIKKGPLYVDSTNNRVGIKTVAPDLALHVEGTNAAPASSGSTSTGFVSLRQKDGGSSHGANIGVLGVPPWGTWIQGQDANNLATSYPLLLNPNGGNVSIGNENPQHKFHITHSGTGAIPTDYQMGATSPNDNYQGIHNNSNSATFSGLALETRTSGASRWLIANEWKNTYLGDLVFRNRNGGTTSQESMRIDSSGRVTMPYQPAFSYIGLNNSWANNSSYQTLLPTSTKINRGNHYNGNTGVFTAPISGVYFFGFWGLVYSNSGQVLNWRYSLNGGFGSQFVQSSGATGNHTNTSGSIILSLAANDTVTLDVNLNSQTSAVPWPVQWNMYGYLMF